MKKTSTIADSGSTVRPLVSRATVLILAVVLLTLGIGARLGTQNARIYLLWGSFGLSVYLVLEAAAKYRSFRKRVKTSTALVHKLDQFVTTDYTIQFVRRDPCCNSAAGAAEKTESSAPRYLLVVDDEPQVCKLTARMLENAQIPVRTCALAEEALELAHDAIGILCDVHLAGTEGPDLVHRLRQHGYSGPIIMMSGDSTRSTVKESLDAGSDDYLVKPFEQQSLLRRVRRLIPVE